MGIKCLTQLLKNKTTGAIVDDNVGKFKNKSIY